MKRATTLLLQVALLLSLISTLMQAVIMIMQQGFGIGRWYWGGSIAVFLGPVVLAAAQYIFNRAETVKVSESMNA